MSAAEIALRGVGFSHGPNPVLADITATVGPSTRLAVVGPTGVGKSTLLKAVGGDLAAETGQVSVSPPSASVVLLPQERDRRAGETLREYLSRPLEDRRAWFER